MPSSTRPHEDALRSDLTFSLQALLASLSSSDFLAINDQAEIVHATLHQLEHFSSVPDPLQIAGHQLIDALTSGDKAQIASSVSSLTLLLPTP